MSNPIYSFLGKKIYRNGKPAAEYLDDELIFKHGFKQYKDEIEAYLKELDEEFGDEKPEAEEVTPPVEEVTPPAEEPAPSKGKTTEPPQSIRFGDLTDEVVRWRHENWPKKKFQEHYHRRLSAFPDLED